MKQLRYQDIICEKQQAFYLRSQNLLSPGLYGNGFQQSCGNEIWGFLVPMLWVGMHIALCADIFGFPVNKIRDAQGNVSVQIPSEETGK